MIPYFSEDQGDYQTLLQQTQLPLVEYDQCQTLFRDTHELGKRFNLDNSFICAGGEEGQDTCKGDGGGPLVCPSISDPESYTQVMNC